MCRWIRNKSYWYDFSKIAGGHALIIEDAKNWPAMEGRSLSGYQSKHLWLNDGSGKFIDVAQSAGATDTYDGRAVAMADLWNTGALDVVVANERGPLLIYKNTVTPENKWIEFALEGTTSNRSAIGAQVTLYLERAAAGAGSFGRERICGAESAADSFWVGEDAADREGCDSVAVGEDADADARSAKIGEINVVKEPS